MRSRFDEQLDVLNKSLIEMGALIEDAIEKSTKTLLVDKNSEHTDEVYQLENEIDKSERFIEQLCYRLLLQQQPVARDLRYITAAVKMTGDMERIGDQASDIAHVVQYMNTRSFEYLAKINHIKEMSDGAIKMVNDCVDAFINKDVEKAHAVMAYDDVVDDLFDEVKQEITELIRLDSESGDAGLDFLMIAKYLERIGDHAVNIAEWVEYSVTGNLAEHVVRE